MAGDLLNPNSNTEALADRKIVTTGDVRLADAVVTGSEIEQLAGSTETWVNLKLSWSGKNLNLEIAESDRVYDLKAQIQSMTNIPPVRQKILGLVKGKLPPDEDTIASLKLTSGKKFTLIGTPEGEELKERSQLEELPDIFNDFDVDFSAYPEAAKTHLNDQRNRRKIREMTQKLNPSVMHPLREGKKLLVLDIDYTILDTKPLLSGALPPIECARPRLHEFLEAVYPHYDICIWSQTSWVWLETKLFELGMIGSDRSYRISFVLDKTVMFKVFTQREGRQVSHHVKALQIIWNHFPQYNSKNTIHVDDLGRNFALNPKEGLKISAFKDAFTPRAAEDRELDVLAQYMIYISNLDDLRTVDHKDWKVVSMMVNGLPRMP